MIRLIFLVLIFLNGSTYGAKGDTKGNGSDYLETLFADAKIQASLVLNKYTADNLDTFELPDRYKRWLTQTNNEFKIPNLELLQMYLAQLSLEFLEFEAGGCYDPDLRIEHGICYYDDNPYLARVVISKDRNKSLIGENHPNPLKQAMIMLIHEAGHFVGQKHHIFLNDLATNLLKAINVNERKTLYKYTTKPFLEGLDAKIEVNELLKTVTFKNIKFSQHFLITDDFSGDRFCSILGLGSSISVEKSLKDPGIFTFIHPIKYQLTSVKFKTAKEYFKMVQCKLYK